MSEETIEEAAKIELEYFHESARGFDFDLGFKTGMVKGAAWQEKRMYSEEVEVRQIFVPSSMIYGINTNPYKIIIPTEEPEQDYKKRSEEFTEILNSIPDDALLKYAEPNKETLRYICPQTKKQCDDECCVSAKDCHIESGRGILSDSKQETIEEAAKIIFPFKQDEDYIHLRVDLNREPRNGFIAGAAWQEKRMYSEEEMREAYKQGCKNPSLHESHEEKAGKWFEQFKKQKG